MNIVPPTWTLRRECPMCNASEVLALVACPACAAIALVCIEEGTVFLDPRVISVEDAANPATARCRSCAQVLVRDFDAATSAQLQAARFTVDDYT